MSEINDLLTQVDHLIKDDVINTDAASSKMIDLYNLINQRKKTALDEYILLSRAQEKIASIIPRELVPIAMGFKLSKREQISVYEKLVREGFIAEEGDSRQAFLDAFNYNTPGPEKPLSWIKTGRNKRKDLVALLNFLLLIGCRKEDLERTARIFWGETFSKATLSRAGGHFEMKKLGELLGIQPDNEIG